MLLILLIATKNETEYYMPLDKYQVLGWTATKAEVKQAIIEEFGIPFSKIVECESGFNVRAVSKPNFNGTIDAGVFQINSSNLKEAKEKGYDLSTVQGQFDYVRFLIKRRGFEDWTCKKVLKKA